MGAPTGTPTGLPPRRPAARRARAQPVIGRTPRTVAVLAGVLGGYFLGRTLEADLGWANLRLVAMVAGGILTGALARLVLPQTGSPPPSRAEDARTRGMRSLRPRDRD